MQLRSILPLPVADVNRIAVWMLAALRPTGPYPILIITGPPASGKSTVSSILRSLLDPHAMPLQTAPTSERELFRHALHNRILAFDHVPSLEPPIATAFARVAAGTSFTLRGNHPYDDPLPFDIQRPIIVTVPYSETNAANWKSYRTIQSLAVTVHLAAIAPEHVRTQRDIETRVQDAAPAILATLCNAASAALAGAAEAPVGHSRFTDLQQWVAAARPVLGLTAAEANAVLMPSPIVTAIIELLSEEYEWIGTATMLKDRIRYERSTKALVQQLNALPLALYGIHFESLRSPSRRTIRLTMTDARKNLSWACGTSVMA